MKNTMFLFFSFVYCLGIAQEDLQKEEINAQLPIVQKTEDKIIEDARIEGGIDVFQDIIYEQFDFENVQKKDLEEFKKTGNRYFYVKFVIDENGNSVDFTSPNIDTKNSLFQEAKRVIMLCKWQPAKLNGEPQRQRFVLPIVVSTE